MQSLLGKVWAKSPKRDYDRRSQVKTLGLIIKTILISIMRLTHAFRLGMRGYTIFRWLKPTAIESQLYLRLLRWVYLQHFFIGCIIDEFRILNILQSVAEFSDPLDSLVYDVKIFFKIFLRFFVHLRFYAFNRHY